MPCCTVDRDYPSLLPGSRPKEDLTTYHYKGVPAGRHSANQTQSGFHPSQSLRQCHHAQAHASSSCREHHWGLAIRTSTSSQRATIPARRFDWPGTVDLLLGVDALPLLMKEKIVYSTDHFLWAIATAYGWVIPEQCQAPEQVQQVRRSHLCLTATSID